VFPRFKNHRLDQIQRVELRNFLDNLLMKGLAAPSVNRIKEEAELLLKEVKVHQRGLYYPPLLFALRNGMRIGEIEALK